jgi:hypothetical protein
LFPLSDLEILETALHTNPAFLSDASKHTKAMPSYQVSGTALEKQENPSRARFYRAETVAQLRRKIDELSTQQVELSEQREEVLVDRQSFVQSTARVREQLFKSVKAATTLMNAFRKHYNEIDTSLPEELVSAYNTLDEEKDKLGHLEVEYQQAEVDLGALEWKVVELENDLYQYDLQQILPNEDTDNISVYSQESIHTAIKTPDPVPVSAAVQYQVAFSDYSQMMHYYEFLRGEIARRLIDESKLSIEETELQELTNSGFVQAFIDLLKQIADCEVTLKNLRRQLVPHEDMPGFRSRRRSEPAFQAERLYDESDIISLVQSESAVSDLQERGPSLHRVRDWLLDCLKQNALDKARYLVILQQALARNDVLGTHFSEWEDLATRQWPLDTIGPMQMPNISIRPSTEDTVQIASVGETEQIPEKQLISTNTIDAREEHFYRDEDPNLHNSFIIVEPPDGNDYSRYPMTETPSTTVSSVDADEEFASGQYYISRSTQTLASTIIQEEMALASPNVDAMTAQNVSKSKALCSQEVAMEQRIHPFPSLAGSKEVAHDTAKETRADLSVVDETIADTISGDLSLPAQDIVPKTSAGSDRCDSHLFGMEGFVLMGSEPRNTDGSYFFERFRQTSLPSIHQL